MGDKVNASAKNCQRNMRYFEGDVFLRAKCFPYCWPVWEVILTATWWSLSVWLLLL